MVRKRNLRLDIDDLNRAIVKIAFTQRPAWVTVGHIQNTELDQTVTTQTNKLPVKSATNPNYIKFSLKNQIL